MSARPQQQRAQASSSNQYSAGGDGESVVRIKPFHYVHVHDTNSSVTRVIVGPLTFTRQEHERVVFGPEPMVVVPPRNYCVISNPVQRDAAGKPETDEHHNYKIRHGDEELRLHQEPFPLYPGEKLTGKVVALEVVAPDTALRLRSIRDFTDENGKAYTAGDEWLFKGPGTYLPRVEVQIVEKLHATIIRPNQALLVKARNNTVDYEGNTRKVGEEWLVRRVGAYLPNVEEEVLETKDAYVLTDRTALHLRAIRSFTDSFNVARKAGEEWLITSDVSPSYIPDVCEQVVGQVKKTTLAKNQYCVVLDPIGDDSKPQYGRKELRVGEVAFFLKPGERLENNIQNVYLLSEEEALLLRAREEFDGHAPGDRWMIYGPRDFIPPVQVEVIERRRAIALDENEGIYVRDIKTGKVRAEIGRSYMLLPNEELFEKQLTDVVTQLLQKEGVDVAADKTRVIRLCVPHNAAMQIYDYKEKKSRVVFGPELVLLGPDEHITVLSLSGGKPKRPHAIQSLYLLLGPDFMTDVVTVETSDHARLQLKLSYNWHFEVDREAPAKIFQLPDFVGDACKAIASNVRIAVASVNFDTFHKTSAKLIRGAVFGHDDKGKILDRFVFNSNNLIITNIDIQSVEPVDQRTRDSLQKSVQLAIEITTKSQEAYARHEAQSLEQEARGRLDRQKITDEAENEKARKNLLELQAQSSFVETTGQATAEARARSEAAEIEAQAAVAQAEFRAKSQTVESSTDLDLLKARREAELSHLEAMQELELNLSRSLAEIETFRFRSMISTIGPDTIAAIARAGPEMQAKLLEGLGIQSLMITDGNSPINLFNTANGLTGFQQQ
jgi:major vault protein